MRGEPGEVLDDRLTHRLRRRATIRPLTVQRAGRGRDDAGELLRGFPIPAGHDPARDPLAADDRI